MKREQPARKPATRSGGRRPVTPAHVVDATAVLARDVMQTDVLVLQADDTIVRAAEQLDEIRASGAPVVDSAGRLVGVLTRTDIARSDHVEEGSVSVHPAVREPSRLEDNPEDVDEEFDPDEFPNSADVEESDGRLRVADWMTPGVIQVAPDDTIASICRRMLDEGIHRVFVVERGHLVGVVSTADVMRLLADPPAARTARARRS